MKQELIKGPWSKQEDEILNEYVKAYGPNNWNAFQRLTGHPRSGQSCRLRWLNHLKPNLKKGKLSEEEKQKIIQLRQLGGKWSKIAEQIPGRTDNGIKNFYNINERKKHKMENDNKECGKKKKKINYLPLNDEILKPHDNELNDNGESSNQQQDISDSHEMELVKDSFHIPIMQPSNMLCNNVASPSIGNNSSPTFIDKGIEAPFMPAAMISNFPLPESLNFQSYESPLQSYTSIRNNSFPKIIDRGEAPFMPMGMVSNMPPLLESLDFQPFESPLHSYTSTSNKSSPTFIDRGETSIISKDMESNLPPLPESINFQSLESSLIHKYPPLPLRTYKEIQEEQQLELDSPFNNGLLESMPNTSKILEDSNNSYMHSCETRLVDESEKQPISLKKDESISEDLIDLFDSLGWFDNYIF